MMSLFYTVLEKYECLFYRVGINIFKQYWKIVKKSTQFLHVKDKIVQLCFFVEHNHITSLSICVQGLEAMNNIKRRRLVWLQRACIQSKRSPTVERNFKALLRQPLVWMQYVCKQNKRDSAVERNLLTFFKLSCFPLRFHCCRKTTSSIALLFVYIIRPLNAKE